MPVVTKVRSPDHELTSISHAVCVTYTLVVYDAAMTVASRIVIGVELAICTYTAIFTFTVTI